MPQSSSAKKPFQIRFDEREIDKLFAWALPDVPGAAVGISIGGEPVYLKGFGSKSSTNIEPLRSDTPMRVGSVTKQFACFAYGLLCEAGKAGLDDKIENYLPDLHPVARKATMRQLMGNISGLRDALDINWHSAGSAKVSSKDILSLYREISDVNGEARATWIYNNGGFLMLSAAIERITGRSLEEALDELIFEPLDMRSSRLQRQDTSGDDHAQLHLADATGGFREAHIGTALAGEGGLISAVDDLLKWTAEMDRHQLGSHDLWRQMTSSQLLSNGTDTGYALGLMRGRLREFDTIYHPGGLLGGSAQVVKVPELGLDVVVISNRSDMSAIALAQNIIDAVVPDPNEREHLEIRPITGVYQSKETGRLIELYLADGVQFACLDGTTMPLEPGPDGRLRPGGVYGYLKQFLDIGGQDDRLNFEDFGNADTLYKLLTDDLSEDRNDRAGFYKADSAPLEANIERSAAGYQLSIHGPFGVSQYGLERLVETVWKLRPPESSPWGGLICFTDRGFWFSNGYFTRRLDYRRVH